MKKTIFLSQNPNGFSTNVSKWMYLLFGIFNSVSGIERLTDTSPTNFTIFLGILLLSTGLVMFVMEALKRKHGSQQTGQLHLLQI